MVVLCHYSTRKMNIKVGPASQPMEEELPTPQNQYKDNFEPERDPNGVESYIQGVVKQSMCNGQNGMNPIDHACPVLSLPLNPKLNGMSSCLNGIESVLKEVDEASQKSEESGKGPDTLGVSKPRDIPNETSPSQPSEAPSPHVPNRVSKNIGQGRVLPSWTRRSKPATLSEIPPTQFTTRRKRQPWTSDDFSELPSMRFQASQNDDGVSFLLAEADHQPYQKQ